MDTLDYDMRGLNFETIFDMSLHKGTITSIDHENNTADVDVVLGEATIFFEDVEIFYHCEDDSTDNGASAFAVDDKVWVTNEKGECDPFDSSSLKIVGFQGTKKSCEWKEEWDSTFCGNHIWEERVNYYNDWMGINGVHYCDTAPTIETTVGGGVLHHLHVDNNPFAVRDTDVHVIDVGAGEGTINGIVRVIFNFPAAQLTGVPARPYDNRYIFFKVPYRDRFGVWSSKTYYLAYAGSGVPPIYPPGIEHNELLDGGNPVTVFPGGAQFQIYTVTRRNVTAEYKCDYIRLKRV